MSAVGATNGNGNANGATNAAANSNENPDVANRKLSKKERKALKKAAKAEARALKLEQKRLKQARLAQNTTPDSVTISVGNTAGPANGIPTANNNAPGPLDTTSGAGEGNVFVQKTSFNMGHGASNVRSIGFNFGSSSFKFGSSNSNGVSSNFANAYGIPNQTGAVKWNTGVNDTSTSGAGTGAFGRLDGDQGVNSFLSIQAAQTAATAVRLYNSTLDRLSDKLSDAVKIGKA